MNIDKRLSRIGAVNVTTKHFERAQDNRLVFLKGTRNPMSSDADGKTNSLPILVAYRWNMMGHNDQTRGDELSVLNREISIIAWWLQIWAEFKSGNIWVLQSIQNEEKNYYSLETDTKLLWPWHWHFTNTLALKGHQTWGNSKKLCWYHVFNHSSVF